MSLIAVLKNVLEKKLLFFCTIFALCRKYFAIVLRQNTLNLGLRIGNGLVKVTSYGDDTVIY